MRREHWCGVFGGVGDGGGWAVRSLFLTQDPQPVPGSWSGEYEWTQCVKPRDSDLPFIDSFMYAAIRAIAIHYVF